jgi:amino acid permease
MIASILAFIVVVVRLFNKPCREHYQKQSLECIDGRSNEALCARISILSVVIIEFILLFSIIYCAQFYEDCRNDDDACREYGKRHFGDKVAGIIISGVSVPFVPFVVALWYSK